MPCCCWQHQPRVPHPSCCCCGQVLQYFPLPEQQERILALSTAAGLVSAQQQQAGSAWEALYARPDWHLLLDILAAWMPQQLQGSFRQYHQVRVMVGRQRGCRATCCDVTSCVWARLCTERTDSCCMWLVPAMQACLWHAAHLHRCQCASWCICWPLLHSSMYSHWALSLLFHVHLPGPVCAMAGSRPAHTSQPAALRGCPGACCCPGRRWWPQGRRRQPAAASGGGGGSAAAVPAGEQG